MSEPFTIPDRNQLRRPDDPEPIARELLAAPNPIFMLTDVGEKWERSSIAHEPQLRTFVRETLPTTVENADLGVILPVREYEISPLLIRDIREVTPQAILRDLHRPVKEFYVTPEPIEGTRVIGQLSEEFEKLRAARRVEPLPHIEPTVEALGDDQRRRRKFMTERWEPLLADDAPRRNVVLYPGEEKEEFYVPDFSKYGK